MAWHGVVMAIHGVVVALYGMVVSWHGVARRAAGWQMSHRRLCSAPRLSNGSEWLFHGKDEVRWCPWGHGVANRMLGWPRGQRAAGGAQGVVGVAKGTKNGRWWPGDIEVAGGAQASKGSPQWYVGAWRVARGTLA